MRIRKSIAIILIILFIFIISACTQSDVVEQGKADPDVVHHHFLFYQENYMNENGESIGELFIKGSDTEMEKIASGVKDNSFVYLNQQDKVFFMNEENDLYVYKPGEDKVKLAGDVFSFNGDYSDNVVTYQNVNMDLYIIDETGEDEKVASEVMQYELIGEDLYYIDAEGNYSLYNIDTRQESDIANDVSYFKILNSSGDLVYLNDDYLLYYKESGEDSVRVSSDEVNSYFIQYEDGHLFYLSSEDGEYGSLYSADIAGDVSTEKIASDVYYFDYQNEAFYYLNGDDNLYMKGKDDDKATKLASDIFEYVLVEGNIYFTDKDYQLYKHIKAGEKEKIAADVKNYHIHDNGDVVYLNEDNELFVNDTKISSDIDEYSYFYGNVAYATNDEKLYLMKNLEEDAQEINVDLNKYSSATYHNNVVFTNELGFEDITGVWEIDDGYDKAFLEIQKDGKIIDFLSNRTFSYKVDTAKYQSMDISTENDYLTIKKIDNKTLTLIDSHDEYTLTKSSKDEIDKYIKEVQYQEDVNEIEGLIDGYLYAFTEAIYYGDGMNLDIYIDKNSNFYGEQVKFIKDLYEKGIVEDVVDYRIEDIQNIDANTYNVKVYENYSIYNYKDSTEKMVEQNPTYTIERIDGMLYITDLNFEKGDTI